HGYIADAFFAPEGDTTKLTITPQFTPPTSPTTFNYRTVAGARLIDGSHLITDGVDCGANPLAQDASTQTQCISSPTDLTTVNNDLHVDTNDMTMSAGSPPSVYPGDTASVPFDLKLLGPASPLASFALSATTGLAGATAAPGAGNQALSPGDNAQSVGVPVPISATPGSYPVTLTAANGAQSRSASGSLTVLALPSAPLPTFKSKTATLS